MPASNEKIVELPATQVMITRGEGLKYITIHITNGDSVISYEAIAGLEMCGDSVVPKMSINNVTPLENQLF